MTSNLGSILVVSPIVPILGTAVDVACVLLFARSIALLDNSALTRRKLGRSVTDALASVALTFWLIIVHTKVPSDGWLSMRHFDVRVRDGKQGEKCR